MKAFACLLTIFLCLTALSQTGSHGLELNLDFEKKTSAAQLPDGWAHWGNGYRLQIDNTEKNSGNASLMIEPALEKKADYAGIAAYRIPANYLGKEIELRGFLKLENVSDGYAGLLLRLDGGNQPLGFQGMEERNLNGTSGWTSYSLKMPLMENAEWIVVGAILTGRGKLWVDDLQILIDGKDISQAALRPNVTYKAAQDKEFDNGSKIVPGKLSKSQIENLTVLGQIWGFLKYHHPAIARGDYNWDYELFRIMPKILASKNRAGRNAVLIEWIKNLGDFENVETQNSEKEEIKLRPDFSWITEKNLGSDLVRRLNLIKIAKRSEKHYYISFNGGVGNPRFDNENPYRAFVYPDAGFRLLSLFRYWNVIQYFFPYRHLIDEDWNNVLSEFIPQFARASGELEYKKTALALIVRIHDTHANIWGKDETLEKFRGLNALPVGVRRVAR
jgi:hypothetical protein